jgi:hypothetical protein
VSGIQAVATQLVAADLPESLALQLYGAIANPPLLPVNGPCPFDEEIPPDRSGFYTIVVSLPEDRPATATVQCGVAWMDWGKGTGSHARA